MVRDLFAGGALLLAVSVSGARLLLLPPTYLLAVLALYITLTTVLVSNGYREGLRHGLGPANRVTLVRACLVLSLVPLLWHSQALTPAGLWWTIALGTLAMILDGVDGWAARHTESATAFGARFDMELDTLLTLVLALLVWQTGKIGVWILGLGVMRYTFALAGYVFVWLRRRLPESFRRKAACVIQGVTLLVCLGPIIPSHSAKLSAAVGLSILLYSFGVDVWFLWSHRRQTMHS